MSHACDSADNGDVGSVDGAMALSHRFRSHHRTIGLVVIKTFKITMMPMSMIIVSSASGAFC